eukprot:gene3816-4404_t
MSESHENQPVPLGGKLIPEGLDANWMDQPIIDTPAVKEDYGEEYNETERLREEIGNVKKVVSLICAPVQAIYGYEVKIEASTTDEEKQKLEALIVDQRQKRDVIIEQLEKIAVLFDKHPEYVSYKEGIQELIALSRTTFASNEEHFNFGVLAKKVTTNIFRDQRVLLDKMKAIKKAKAAAK